jgi:hypothetical protein
MIICNTNNFVVIRPPKTGSTSLVFYFFKSGLVQEQDLYAIDGPFSTWKDLEVCLKKYGENFSYVPRLTKKDDEIKNVHISFDELVEKNLVTKTIPCVATIRNPLARYSSAFYFARNQFSKQVNGTPYVNSNAFWDALKNKEPRMGVEVLAKPQCDYFPDHAELFNTENLHEHVSKYILERGR